VPDRDNVVLKVGEFAEMLNIRQATVRRWLLVQRIESVRFGRAVRIPASEAERLIAEGRRPRRGNDA